ncbi:MAG TPA: IPT/TIG domain-containing protein [Thermoanaerobaculia bacterium]|nr:IPT/TIG domain-containing protein [Thermoanaerobaculia bacterium]
MMDLRQRQILFALLALLLVFAGCKGESPTAPPLGGTPPGTPPTGANVTITFSNPTPLTDSSTGVTATVTINGSPAPAGTAVEFSTTLGRFEDTGTNSTLRVTNAQGQATVSLTSSTAGTATVTAVVNNVVQRASVTFTARPVTPTPTPTGATITGVAPSVVRDTGVDVVTITGTNFREPVRVFFDIEGQLREAQVISVTPTQIQVLAPKVNLTSGQTVDSSVVVFVEHSTPNEQRITATTPVTFRRAQLTPSVVTVSPDGGPLEGGTQFTIFGDGFEAPVQVSLGDEGAGTWTQIQVIRTDFNQIIAVTPPSRDINSTGIGTLGGHVDLRIININSGTVAILANAFRYAPLMEITTVRPLIGSSLGGTDVTIDGVGFDDPLQVTIGGVIANDLRVSGTQLLVRTGALPNPCGGGGGSIVVVNTNTGARAEADQTFTYVGVDPIITGITSAGPITPGSTISVTVQNPGVGVFGTGIARFRIGSQTISPTPNVITAGTGNTTFTVAVPLTGFDFPTVTCTTAGGNPAGTRLGPVDVSIQFVNATTGCTTTLDNGLRVEPPGPNLCQIPPTASVNPAAPTCADAGSIVSAGAITGQTNITITNAPDARPLVISAVAVGAATNGTITAGPAAPVTIPAGASQIFTVTVDPAAAGPVTGNVTFTTNDPARTTITTCVTATGT